MLHAIAVLSLLGSVSDSARDPLVPSLPSFELKLTLPELSVLHSAAWAGVQKYGGTADFRQTLLKEGEQTLCRITIDDPRLMEVWIYWMAERTSELVGSADLDRLDGEHRLALQIAKTVNQKLAQAKAYPIWKPVEVVGTIRGDEGKLYLDSPRGRFELLGEKLGALSMLAGRDAILRGIHKESSRFEVQHGVERRANTLEIFVMSHCPYAKQAELAVFEFARHISQSASPPKIELRYLFFPSENGAGYSSLHGEKEIEENVVQIVLRDHFPAAFPSYVLERARGEIEAPWEVLCKNIGLDEAERSFVREKVASERNALIEIEHDYAEKTYGTLNASPTFVWEGRIVADLREIQTFAGIDLSLPASCSR